MAKRSINQDRAAKFEEQRRRKQIVESLEYSANVPSRPLSSATMGGSGAMGNGGVGGGGAGGGGPARTDAAGSPSQESSGGDPAPTRHAPTTEAQRVAEKSKYESTTPFRSPKGDRFT